MAVVLTFHFPSSVLQMEGDGILKAAEAHADQMAARLPKEFLAEARTALGKVANMEAAQQSAIAAVSQLTNQLSDKQAAVEMYIAKVKETAKRAFKAQDGKLRSEFQVAAKGGGVAGMLERARIMAASCAKPENAAALGSKGWLEKDTQAFNIAIEELDKAATAQEASKTERLLNSDQRNTTCNDAFDRLLTIQNAADLEWPESDAANRQVRMEFKLGVFPPKTAKKSGNGEQPEPEPPTPVPAAAQPPAPAVPQPADANK